MGSGVLFLILWLTIRRLWAWPMFDHGWPMSEGSFRASRPVTQHRWPMATGALGGAFMSVKQGCNISFPRGVSTIGMWTYVTQFLMHLFEWNTKARFYCPSLNLGTTVLTMGSDVLTEPRYYGCISDQTIVWLIQNSPNFHTLSTTHLHTYIALMPSYIEEIELSIDGALYY